MKRFSQYKPVYIFTLLSLSLLQGSCAGYNCAPGFVQDDADRSSPGSIQVEVISGTSTVYTDTNGQFETV